LAHFCLFIYFELVLGIIKYCQLHIYADHLQIYRSSNIAGFQECYDKGNLDLGRIHEWTTINGLRLNPTKSQVILIHQSKAVIPHPSVFTGTDVVNWSTTVVNSIFFSVFQVVMLVVSGSGF
jgi:hypothetical protein